MKKKIEKPGGVRAHVFYSGRVQGVGFRYTAERLALELALNGFVKTLPDGRVELVCEGSKERVESLLDKIKKDPALGPHIRKASCAWEEPTGEHADFRIEFVY